MGICGYKIQTCRFYFRSVRAAILDMDYIFIGAMGNVFGKPVVYRKPYSWIVQLSESLTGRQPFPVEVFLYQHLHKYTPITVYFSPIANNLTNFMLQS